MTAIHMLPASPASAQDKSQESSRDFPLACPDDQMGVLINDGQWQALEQEPPQKNRVKHGALAAMTNGVVPAGAISEYAGLHSETEVHLPRPVVCVRLSVAIQQEPILVRLHPDPKHDLRFLDRGRMPPVGAKILEVKHSDVVSAVLVRPDRETWLLRPTQELPEGEYAIMVGTQNFMIFTFSVAKLPATKNASTR
jgi:hypothetical protein